MTIPKATHVPGWPGTVILPAIFEYMYLIPYESEAKPVSLLNGRWYKPAHVRECKGFCNISPYKGPADQDSRNVTKRLGGFSTVSLILA